MLNWNPYHRKITLIRSQVFSDRDKYSHFCSLIGCCHPWRIQSTFCCPTTFHQSATIFSHSSTSKTQLWSSDSPPLWRCGERVVFTEDPASECCCLEELERSMATSSSMSSSCSSSRSRSSSGSTSWASLRLHRSEELQKVLQRLVSVSVGLKHFLDISNDFLCIPVLRDGHSVQSWSSCLRKYSKNYVKRD